MALYTPFFAKAAETVGQGYGQKIMGELAQSAYMGDQQALGELFRLDPNLGQQIKNQKLQEEQAKLSTQAQQQQIRQNDQQFAMQNKQVIESISQRIASADTFEQGRQIAQSEIANLEASGVQVPAAFRAETLTPESFNQLKQLYAQSKPLMSVAADAAVFDPNTNQPVFTNTRPEKPKEPDQREQKIANIAPQLISQFGMTPEQAETEAANITDGNIVYEALESGQVRRVDKVSGEVREVPIKASGEAVPAPAPGRTLFELATQATGPASAVRAGLAQVGLGDPKVLEARTEVTNAMQELVRSLAVNPRFPVGEIDRIRNDVNLDPRIIDNAPAMQARMRGLEGYLERRQAQAERDANDPSLPQDLREGQASNASAIRNFRAVMGVPKSISAEFLSTPAAVKSMDRESLEYFVQNASDADLNALPDDVVQEILKNVGSAK